MNFDNFFKNMWGFSRRDPSHEQSQFPNEDEEETQTPDLFQERLNSFQVEAEEMMTHFEKHFENIFKGFMDFGENNDSVFLERQETEPSPEAPLRDRFLKVDEHVQEIPTIRDKLLKKPDSDRQLRAIPNDEPSFERPQGWFSSLFNRRPVTDKDLDEDILSQGIDQLLKQQPSEVEPTFKSGFSNKSSVTVFSSDGKSEQRYSERDQYGNEKTVVIRTLGDKQHHFTIKKNDKGVTQEENFVNLDEGNLNDFNKEFDSSNRQHLPNNRLGDFPLSDLSAPGIYQRLFGNLLLPPKPKS